jgi:hypothetical protein
MHRRRSFGFLLVDQCDQRQSHLNAGAFAGGVENVRLAPELVDALAHAGNSDAEKRISAIAVRRQGHADAVVTDGKAYLCRCTFDGNLDCARLGVAVHVGERLLRDAEEGEFYFLGKALEIFGEGEIHRDAAALREEANIGAETDGETGFIHQWWVQDGGNSPDFADGIAGERALRFRELAGALIILRK